MGDIVCPSVCKVQQIKLPTPMQSVFTILFKLYIVIALFTQQKMKSILYLYFALVIVLTYTIFKKSLEFTLPLQHTVTCWRTMSPRISLMGCIVEFLNKFAYVISVIICNMLILIKMCTYDRDMAQILNALIKTTHLLTR